MEFCIAGLPTPGDGCRPQRGGGWNKTARQPFPAASAGFPMGSDGLRWVSDGTPVGLRWSEGGSRMELWRSRAGVRRDSGTADGRNTGTPGKILMRAGIFAFAFSYLCSRNKNCKDGNGKRVSNRGEQPLRGVVALQRGTHVRLFRPGGQPHRIHDGRVARGRRGEQPHDAPPPA